MGFSGLTNSETEIRSLHLVPQLHYNLRIISSVHLDYKKKLKRDNDVLYGLG